MHRPIGAVDVKKGKVVTLWTENRTKKVNDRSIRRNRYKNNGVRRKIVKRKIKIKESIRYEIRKLETTTRYKSGCRANVEVTESARDRQKKKKRSYFFSVRTLAFLFILAVIILAVITLALIILAVY